MALREKMLINFGKYTLMLNIDSFNNKMAFLLVMSVYFTT